MSLLSNLIPKVKCGRCDRSYSGLKHRCPYCGAGRSRGGKRASDAGDASARRMIKVLLLLVLVITVISIAVLDPNADPSAGNGGAPPGMTQPTPTPNGDENGDDGYELPPTPTPQPTPPPAEVTSISITWAAQRPGVNDFSLNVGNRLELWAEVFPTDAAADIEWVIDTPTVANITINPEDFRRVELVARGVGQTILRATAGGESAYVIVRVR